MTEGDSADASAFNFERLYRYRFRDVDQEARQRVWDVIAPYIYEQMGRPARVLDPAGGRAEFLNAIDAEERWLVDFVDHGFADSQVKTLTGDVMETELPLGYFDGVFVSNFLEHLPTQAAVAAFLGRMRDVCAAGASVVIMGPNFKYCSREYFDCADHTLALTHVAVEEHLYAAGYRITKVVPRFLPFSFRGMLPPVPALTGAYLRMPPAWRVLGKQFLVLATPETA